MLREHPSISYGLYDHLRATPRNPSDLLEHPREQDAVNRPGNVPVGAAQESARIKDCGLPYHRIRAIPIHAKLQPGSPWQFRPRRQTEAVIRRVWFHSPAIHDVANFELVGIPTAASQPWPPHPDVHDPTKAPRPIGIVPASRTSDPADRRECLLGGGVDGDSQGIAAPTPTLPIAVL